MPGSLSTKIALGSLKDFGCSLTLTCSWPQWQTHMFTSFWDQPGYENPICPETKVISVKPSWVSYDLLVLKTQYEVGETNWNQGTPPKKCASHRAPRASPRRLSLKLTAADHAMGWTKITRRQSLLGYSGVHIYICMCVCYINCMQCIYINIYIYKYYFILYIYTIIINYNTCLVKSPVLGRTCYRIMPFHVLAILEQILRL
jgi:hypothetical protein